MATLKGKTLNKEIMPTEQDKEFELPQEGETLDYSRFKPNNWMMPKVKNKLLEELDKRGGALWLTHDGIIRYRVRVDESISSIESVEQASRALTSFLKRDKVRLFKGTGGQEARPPEIYIHELLGVKDEFTPFALSEFYKKNGLWYRTAFRPTNFIKREYGKKDTETPETILKLIKNLANGNEDYYTWILNWVAGFFQTLRKSQVSLVLRGDQGSGKGVFFNKVLTPLFGKDYCITIDSNNLESNFKNWIEGKLFLNLNEVAVDMKARRNVKNFLKQLVTDEYVNVEIKHKDANEVKVHANVYITSNEAFPIEIEPNDRRFTVMQTGKGLKAQGLNMAATISGIVAELPAFAEYLHGYAVDWRMYDTAMDTAEKRAIVDGTTSQVRRYIHALIEKDMLFFRSQLEDNDDRQESERFATWLAKCFETGRIEQSLVVMLFDKIFDTKKTAKKLMAEIRSLSPDVFGREKLKKSGNVRFYEI